MNSARQIAQLAVNDERFKDVFIPMFLEAYYSDHKNVVVVEDNGKIIAFAHYWMITKEALDKLKDLQFNVERMKRTIEKRGNNIHIVSIVINKDYRGNGLVFKMKEQLKVMEPEALTLSWLTPNLDRLVNRRIIRR